MSLQDCLTGFENHTDEPIKILIITDAGVDLDDEWALIIAAALQRLGFLHTLAVTANMKPSIARARLTLGTLTSLGFGHDLPSVPVGMGLGMIESRNGEPVPTEENCPYLASRDELYIGDEKFVEILMDAEPQSITLVLQSGFTDAALLAMFHADLLRSRVKEVVIMGGVEEDANGNVKLEHGLMTPNDANNNTFNYSASQIFYTWCQQNNLPMIITTRHAAAAAQVPFSLYDTLAQYPCPIGPSLRERQFPSIRLLWKRANSPANSDERGPLPPNRDRQWFTNVFCSGEVPANISGDDDIVPFLGKFNLYDPINVLAAIPQLREQLFNPVRVDVQGTTHRIIGLNEQLNGVARPTQVTQLLTTLAETGIARASAANKPFSSTT